jgi:hypothetical protein
MIRGLATSLAGYCALLVLGVFAIDRGTVDDRNVRWVILGAVAGFAAGFAGDRLAIGASHAARLTAAIAGPALIALALAATATGDSQSARWGALGATFAGAVLGAAAREWLGTAQRRRA